MKSKIDDVREIMLFLLDVDIHVFPCEGTIVILVCTGENSKIVVPNEKKVPHA